MTQENAPKGDRIGNDYSRGPNPNPGGDIDTGESAVPPYEGRSTESTATRDTEEMAHSRDVGDNDAITGDAPAGEDGQSASDLPPEGVGESLSRSGEDIRDEEGKEAGRHEEGTAGGADRPEGSSDLRDVTGV